MSRRSVEISRKASQYSRKHSVSKKEATAIVAPYRASQLAKVADKIAAPPAR